MENKDKEKEEKNITQTKPDEINIQNKENIENATEEKKTEEIKIEEEPKIEEKIKENPEVMIVMVDLFYFVSCFDLLIL